MGKFTDTYIKALKPSAKRYEEYEGEGFGIRVTPKGVKSWIYRYKMDGKTDKITLGHYPNLSLANAKKLFLELRGQRLDGQSPKILIKKQEIEKEKRKINTVSKLVLEWYSGYVIKERKRPETIRKQIEGDIIPLLGEIDLDDLKTVNITHALDAIVNRGAPVHANRVLSSLKQLFNYAVSRGRMQHNPAAGIRAKDIGGSEKSRERFLSIDEIKILWCFLDSDKNQMAIQTKIAIKIILLTGVRTAELRLAQWNEFNFEQSLWTIPAAHVKAGIIIKIHLSSKVKALLVQLKAISKSCYVLPGADAHSPLTENALPRAIKRIQERVGILPWTAHDLRRTFATQLGESLHVDPVIIEKCLGHKMPRIMATYNKNEMLPQRKEALNQWARFVEDLIQNPELNRGERQIVPSLSKDVI
ncbi:tyrosine-type recombinase/integrase [Legionella fairfieldensis]|uniref:tyrosine-type recombinase/integrase n=1 Tax=Legionella fairfieldensis TaxID=45064 RepID=UPI00048F8A2B|nr:site-specific integrase [Legionella fairfieldensis]